jgi:pseudaminic acid synthase
VKDIQIGNWNSADKHTYIIAELSANHNQDIGVAREIIYQMKDAGADAIKLQTYTPDTMTIDCDRDHFIIGKGSPWEGRKLYDLYAEAMTPWEWHTELFQIAKEIGLDCFSTPFDKSSVDFLENFNPPVYKIASFEINDLKLIEYVASKGKPMIISIGMANLGEIMEAVATVKDWKVPLALLKCTSAYPSPPDDMNLVTIPHLSETFSLPTGLSDHTLGISAPIAAVALGASIIEKHVTLDRRGGGPDDAFSLEPQEFKKMVAAVREVEKAIGSVKYSTSKIESGSRVFRRSLFFVKDVNENDLITLENVRCIRPGNGLSPNHLDNILGMKVTKNVKKGTPVSWELFSK